MSMYNMLFGQNPNTDVILALIGFKESDVERYRDCHIDFDNKTIGIYTRTGGGNREDYTQEKLVNSPYYLRDEDDDYDCTYATFYFKFPEEIEQDILGLKNPSEFGLSAKLISQIVKTLNREPTEGDKHAEAYREQLDVIKRLGNQVEIFNGHTVVPLTDRAMEAILAVCEENNGDFVAYWYLAPHKLTISKSESPYMLKLDTTWKVDVEVWERYKAKFLEKYPKTMGKLSKMVEEDLTSKK